MAKGWRVAMTGVAIVAGGTVGPPAAAQVSGGPAGGAGAVVQGPGVMGASEGVAGRAAAQMSGRELYARACASCHGSDGRGAAPERVAFTVPVPDFTECSFSSREPDADWLAVVHQGGPVRAFDETMPSFGEALTEDQIQQILEHVRTFCDDASWPRGELNLPRSIFTEKAYPEDEAVLTVDAAVEGAGSVLNEFVYEKRFGARNQLEIVVPFGGRRAGLAAESDWEYGLGDVEVGLKRVLWHSLSAGTIVSAGGDVKLPTGSESKGFGTGTVVIEPYLAYGQILPADAFVHAQAVVEWSLEEAKAEHEAAWRLVVGRTWTSGTWGRAWSPMVELLGGTELEGGSASWDLVPQMQVTLNTRQHVMANIGVRLPLSDADARATRLVVYVLWDWFDGGFFDGW